MKIAEDRATSSTINVYIRGVGQSDPLWGFDPGVGVYIDDVYLARPQAALLDVIDVAAARGAARPAGHPVRQEHHRRSDQVCDARHRRSGDAYCVSDGGQLRRARREARFSTPVIEDHVYFGVALADLQHGGYGEVVAQPGHPPSPYNSIGEAVSNKDILAGRANLTIKWGESSKLKFIADDILDNSNASGGQRLNDYLVPQLGNPFDTRTDMPVDNDYSHRSGDSATYTQNLTDQLELKIVGAYIRGSRPAIHQISRNWTRTCFRCRASTTISSPRARRN